MKLRKKEKTEKAAKTVSLTEGSIVKGLISFMIPLFLGQLLQQLYNMADTWVIGNFANNNALAAVSSGGSLVFMIIGFFNGVAVGGGVVISRYFGAGHEKNVQRAIHTNFLFGLLSSLVCTVLGLLLVPQILRWMNTPAEVLPYSLQYFRIYCGGVSTVILYNICMSIMRSLGDSLHPLYYLCFSTSVNVVLDLLFVAVFHWGVSGAASATVIAQGISVVLCLVRMCRAKDYTRLDFRKLKFDWAVMKQVILQGFPTGIQNSVISIGNLVVQTNINAFGAYAIAGVGAYSKIEGCVFLPIMSMSMALPTFVSQNLGARKIDRAKKGSVFGILTGMALAEIIGLAVYLCAGGLLHLFTSSQDSIAYGILHCHVVAPFFFLLAFSHCAAGVMRGCGKSIVPMITMLVFWCGVRILYVSTAIQFFPRFQTISWAYPLTWALSTVVFLVFLLTFNWKKTGLGSEV